MIRKTMVWSLVFVFLSAPAFARNPDRYNSYQWNRKNHFAGNGKQDQRPWFEWWYYKVLPQNSDDAFYFVYGVVNPWDAEGKKPGSRSWVGFGSFEHGRIMEEVRAPSEFWGSYDEPAVRIGNNTATANHIQADIVSKAGERAAWNLELITGWRFNAMGWAMYAANLLNIYWYPAQASALMSGWIEYGGKRYVLEAAPAYQDRNWGRSFPEWWTWIVANRFKDHPNAALAIGGGKPKILDRYAPVEGVDIGLRLDGKTYAWRPNDGARIRTKVNFGTWQINATNLRGQKISIAAHAPPEKFLRLPFMTPQGQEFSDYEALRGNVKVSLELPRKDGPKTQELLESDEAGIEYGSFRELDPQRLELQQIELQ